MKKFISMLLVAIAFVGCFSFFGCEPNNNTPEPEAEPQKETTVMSISVSAYMLVILDQNNVVMSVRPITDAASQIMSQVDFVGMDAVTATKTFTDYCVKLGKIPFETGEKYVTIRIASDLDNSKFNNLKTSIKNSINKYFQEEKIKSGLLVYDYTLLQLANNYANRHRTNLFVGETNKEALAFFSEINSDAKGMTSVKLKKFLSECKKIRSSDQTTLDECEKTIKECQQNIKTYESQIDSATGEDLKNLEIKLASAKAKLKNSKEQLDSILTRLEPEFEAAKEEFKRQSESELVEIKEQTNDLLVEGINSLNDYEAKVEQMTNEEKQNLLDEIIAYQNSLN